MICILMIHDQRINVVCRGKFSVMVNGGNQGGGADGEQSGNKL